MQEKKEGFEYSSFEVLKAGFISFKQEWKEQHKNKKKSAKEERVTQVNFLELLITLFSERFQGEPQDLLKDHPQDNNATKEAAKGMIFSGYCYAIYLLIKKEWGTPFTGPKLLEIIGITQTIAPNNSEKESMLNAAKLHLEGLILDKDGKVKSKHKLDTINKDFLLQILKKLRDESYSLSHKIIEVQETEERKKSVWMWGSSKNKPAKEETKGEPEAMPESETLESGTSESQVSGSQHQFAF